MCDMEIIMFSSHVTYTYMHPLQTVTPTFIAYKQRKFNNNVKQSFTQKIIDIRF